MVTRQTDASTTTTYGLSKSGTTNSIVVEQRTTTTTASGTAAISASSALEGFQAKQDGRNQGLRIDRTSQRSDVDKAIDLLGKVAPLAAAMYGVPGARSAPPEPLGPPPAGMKWVIGRQGIPELAPIDNASKPHLETSE